MPSSMTRLPMDMGNGKPLVPAQGVKYLARQWCIMSPDQASISDPSLPNSIAYACIYAAWDLDLRAAHWMLEAMFLMLLTCTIIRPWIKGMVRVPLSNLSTLTSLDPSQNACRFEIMIDLGKHEKPPAPSYSFARRKIRQQPWLS